MSSSIVYVNLRYILAFLLLALVALPSYIYAESGGQLGTKLIPNEIMENTEGILQVYSTTDGVSIDKLIATSSDSSIIQILSVENNQTYSAFNIKIKAVAPGDAKIALAAPGFSSEEVPITVYKNTQAPTQLLIKTTPSTFATNGLTHGYVTVELANNGIPTITTSDSPITITTSDNKIIGLDEDHLVIKQGSYYAVGQFDAKQPGTAQISASSASLQSVSSAVTVNNVVTQNTIQVYVYPQTINAQSSANAYVIVQLHDSSGNPVIAKEDIPITTQVTNTTSTEAVNTSGQQPLVQINGALAITKGSYWAYAPIEVTAGVAGTFNVMISAKGYLVSTPAQLNTVVTNALLDDKSARVDTLPILTTGQKELIGILHLQDSQGNPVLAKGNLSIHVDSSDPATLLVQNINMEYGSQAALVFAQVGSTQNPVTLNVVTDQSQTITPAIIQMSNSVTNETLVADPLVPKVLSQATFPIAIYVTNNGAISSFTKSFDLLVSPKDTIQITKPTVSQGEGILVTDAILFKDGQQSISVTTPDFSKTFTIQGTSSKPQSMSLEYPDRLVSNIKNMFSIELLDSQGNPALADKDMNMQLVSSDPSVVNVPDSVSVTKGSYYTTFDATLKKSGTAEISVLTDEIPLSKFDITVTSLTPDVTLTSTDFTEPNIHFDAIVTATYKGNPLSGLDVSWDVKGANVQNMDTLTDKDGKAKVSLVSTDPNSISIQASVSGGSFETTTVSKQVKVNQPLQPVSSVTQAPQGTDTGQNGFTIMGINPLFIIIPVAVGIAILVLKKREMLQGISEKINIAEKFSEIKERMSELRQK